MHVLLVLCITCVASMYGGQTDASKLDAADSMFGGVSLGFTEPLPGLDQPFIGLTGFYDTQLPRFSTVSSDASVGVLGHVNYTSGMYGSAWSVSPMVCWGQSYENSILHASVGLFMFATSTDSTLYGADTNDSDISPTLHVSWTYYVPETSGERFALNFGVQWWRGYQGENRYRFTITPGFMTLGSAR